VDTLDGGRAALEMIARDIEQAAANNSTTNWNFFVAPTSKELTRSYAPGNTNTVLRTNYLQDIFFLNSSQTNWEGIGYRVLNPKNPDTNLFAGVGTLYRFSTNAVNFNNNSFLTTFWGSSSNLIANTNMVRVIDGVINLRATLYDFSGYQITNAISNHSIFVTNYSTLLPLDMNLNHVRLWNSDLPMMVEIELGVMEPQAYEKLKPLIEMANPPVSNPAPALEFLSRNVGRVHIFRQQIPVRLARQFQ
jgi:hypothetical protein